MILPLMINLCGAVLAISHFCCDDDAEMPHEMVEHGAHAEMDHEEMAHGESTHHEMHEESVPTQEQLPMCCLLESDDRTQAKATPPAQITKLDPNFQVLWTLLSQASQELGSITLKSSEADLRHSPPLIILFERFLI